MPQVGHQQTMSAIRPLVSGLRALGLDPVPSLRAIGIEESYLDDPDAPISMHAVPPGR